MLQKPQLINFKKLQKSTSKWTWEKAPDWKVLLIVLKKPIFAKNTQL